MATAGGACVVGPAHELATTPSRRLDLHIAGREGGALVVWNEGVGHLKARPIGRSGEPAGPETRSEFGLAHRMELVTPTPGGVLVYSLGRGCGQRGASCDHAVALGWNGEALGPTSDLSHRTSQDAAVLWSPTDDGAVLLNHWLWGRPFATRLTVVADGVRRELVGFMPVDPGAGVGSRLTQGVLFSERGFLVLTEPDDLQRRLVVMPSRGPIVSVDEDVHDGAPEALATPTVVGLPRQFELRSWSADADAITLVFRVGRGRLRIARVGYDGRVIGTPIVPAADERLPAPHDAHLAATVEISRGRARLHRRDMLGRPLVEPVDIAAGVAFAAVSWTGESFVVAYTVVTRGVATVHARGVRCGL